MTTSLFPALPPEQLYPSDGVYMARTDLNQTRMLGFTELMLDTVTSMLPGLLNGCTTVRHEAGAGAEVFALYRRAGMALREDTRTYRTQQEAEALVDGLIAQGKRLFWPYPLPAGRYPETAHLVPTALYHQLNAKANLDALVPSENLAPRRILDHDQLAAFEPSGPLFLKASGGSATGWGYAVRPCPDRQAFEEARTWFMEHRDSVPSVIAEASMDVSVCWCAGIAVGESHTICFGGAEQLFRAPAQQSGSLIDPERALPEPAKRLAEHVGEAARLLGFRGIAGLDIGQTTDGRLIVFDPNFRFNASTSQVLFHDSASKRSGLPVSRSFHGSFGGSFQALSTRLEEPISESWFVPTRIFNAEKHPLAQGKHLVTGFVLARDRNGAETAHRDLETRLGC